MPRRIAQTSLKVRAAFGRQSLKAIFRTPADVLGIAALAVFIIAAAFALITNQWRSPASLIKIAPEELHPSEERLFQLVDTAFGRLKLGRDGRVPLNSTTEAALIGAVAELPPDIPPETMNRLQFLVRQSLPGSLGEQFGELLREYYNYKQLEARTIGAPPPTPTIDVEWERFQKTVALQYRHYGADRARRLFGEHHALARYMFALRRVEADPTLSEQQRLAKQIVLQKQYERQRGRSRATAFAASTNPED